MALFRVKLSDSVTTINLYDGSDAKLMEAGLALPPPRVTMGLLNNPLQSGARLLNHSYNERQIGLRLKIWGTSLADLQTNIRSINRLLTDGIERVKLGHGSTVYLEYQWGDTAGQSTFFDVLAGELALPDGMHSAVLVNSYFVLGAVLNLTCKPFARYTNVDVGNATINNHQATYLLKDYAVHTVDQIRLLDTADKWYGGSFQATADYTAVVIGILISKVGSPASGSIELWSTAAGLPNAQLKTVALDMTKIPTYVGNSSPTMYWGVIAGQALTNGTTYAIIIKNAGDGANYVQVHTSSTGPYAGGNFVYTDNAGGLWATIVGIDHSFVVLAAGTAINYQAVDVSAQTPEPDVPCPMYAKLSPSGAAGSKKVWVGKRGGSRVADVLTYLGMSWASYTKITAVAGEFAGQSYGLAASSNGVTGGAYFAPTAGVSAASQVARSNFTLSPAPAGHFRVLVRARINCSDAAEFDHVAFGFGWSYGGTTKTPSASSNEYYTLAAHNTWEVLDLGDIIMPPIAQSDIATDPSLELRIYYYAQDILAIGKTYLPEIDWIVLLPIDEGCAIVEGVGASDVLALDGITDPAATLILDGTAVIQSAPDYVGYPPAYGREDFRLYVVRNDDPGVSWTSALKYQPRFLGP